MKRNFRDQALNCIGPCVLQESGTADSDNAGNFTSSSLHSPTTLAQRRPKPSCNVLDFRCSAPNVSAHALAMHVQAHSRLEQLCT